MVYQSSTAFPIKYFGNPYLVLEESIHLCEYGMGRKYKAEPKVRSINLETGFSHCFVAKNFLLNLHKIRGNAIALPIVKSIRLRCFVIYYVFSKAVCMLGVVI